MTNPYEFKINGLSVVVYAINKTVATQIFNEKLSEHDAQIRAEVLDEVKNALLEKADYIETEWGFYGKVVTENEIEEVIKNL